MENIESLKATVEPQAEADGSPGELPERPQFSLGIRRKGGNDESNTR